MKFYIDPGTGSMLFTVFLGIIGAGIYSARMLWLKLKMIVGGGKVKEELNKTPIVIFSDNKRYWNVFAPVCEELGKRGQNVLYLTASEDDPAFKTAPENVKAEFLGTGNKIYTRLNFLNAEIVLSTTPGLNVYQWKRSKDVSFYVHIPHAASEITLYRMFGIDYYDSILLSGDYQESDIRALEELRGISAKELVKIGIPYMDKMLERKQNAPALPEHERTVLLAPSWGPSAIFGVWGEKIIEVLLATGYHIIIRPHPQSFTSETEMIEKLQKKYPDSDRIEWNRDTDNFDVLNRSDILISDFSGVIFEFALIYDKPVIYTDPNFDLSPYDAWWLDRPLWTVSALERMGEKLTEDNMTELKSLIDRCIEDERFAIGRSEVKTETWVNAGKGAECAADYLIGKLEELSEKNKSSQTDKKPSDTKGKKKKIKEGE